jgi:hypothetical protein
VLRVILINLFLLACFGNSFAKTTVEGKLVAVNKNLASDPGQDDPGQDPVPTPQDPGQDPVPTPQDPGQDDPGQDDPGQESFGF